jgi:hypothetical protein
MTEIIKPGGLNSMMYFVIFSRKTAFFKFEDVFPECFLYRKDSPQLEPLICLLEDGACHVGKNCMETLVKRLHILFEEILQNVDMLLLYYRQNYDPNSIGCGIFWRNLQDFQVRTINRTAWQMVKNRGSVFQFQPGTNFFLSGKAAPPKEPDSSEEVVLD